ncbi:MAG: ThuA domain-containing protein [Novosphingobium sp.]
MFKGLRRFFVLTWSAALAASACPAQAKPVTDCPLRDAPFSADSPLIDILLSDQARAVLNKFSQGRFKSVPEGIFGVHPPTFASIWTLRTSARFTGIQEVNIPEVDRELRALPVLPSDQVSRCARYDDDVPVFDLPKGKIRILIFEKSTGFKDVPSVDAARRAVELLAQQNGWTVATTEKGGAINRRTLAKFHAVIWNNVSGDVLSLSQRRALQRYMEHGGGFVGIHGSAGDPVYYWDWYADSLIGARFLGHPKDPQFQDARIFVNKGHKLAGNLPPDWVMKDEWYSFRSNPRDSGANILLSLDENSYNARTSSSVNLAMADHPIAWTRCINGKGRMFYTAIGHLPEAYTEKDSLTAIEAAIRWAANSLATCNTIRSESGR